MSFERRQSPRIPVALTVELGHGAAFSLHSSSDISSGGCFFDRSIPQSVGSRVEVAIHLPGEAPIRCQGEVVNVPDAHSFGMGVRFFSMSEADQARLEAFTREVDR